MTPASGAAISHSAAISPGWFDPISRTRKSASSGQLRIVSGRPMWLLKLPSVAYVLPTVERNALRSSLVVVLPAEPVSPTTFAFSERRRSRAFSCSASRPSTISAAPRSSACGMKAWPSAFSPFRATKPMPGFTSLESNVYLTLAHPSRGIAVERDKLLDLVELLDLVFDAVEGLRAVEPVAVEEAVRLLERLDYVLGESAAG